MDFHLTALAMIFVDIKTFYPFFGGVHILLIQKHSVLNIINL
jgi:hypothetical protein